MRIGYTVRASEPADHRGRFSIDLGEVDASSVDLVVPSWVPGSYHIVNYVRGFRDLSARAVANGSQLAVERVDKARWRIRTDGATELRVEYTVYGHELVTEAFDLTPEHLFVNAALCLPYVDGHLGDPVEVALEIPSDWRVVTELEEVARDPPRYRAPDYDTLVDNPIDVGHPVVLTIRPAGIPHRISLCGEGGNYDARRLEEDLGKIVEAAVRLVGDSPLKSYTFFYHLSDLWDGGLEHANSNSCSVYRTTFVTSEEYQQFLSLTSHEYFHLYNVKRIRPKVLGPFDYTREVYTRLLWWMEGTTDYFADLILRRAGLATPSQTLTEIAKMARTYLDTPGRSRISLEESSFTAWVDYYQPFEESPNLSVSYYLKGSLVSMCLDLEIRHRTETRASLETVLRALWTDYGRTGRGLAEDELLAVANRATGLDLAPFFARYVQGTDEIDLNAFAQYAGLSFGPKPKPVDDESPVPGYLGVRLENSGGMPRVHHVLLDTPGRQAGLTPGDEIVAINGVRATFDKFEKSMTRFPPGTPIDLTIFRRGYLRHVRLTTGTPPPEKYAFTPVAAPSELARRVYENWLGAAWEPAAGTPPP
ncbi:MAG: PDZ domain-containing protein [Thermoplasmata archaeon]|jgi:predicted metalloprotease with PDZ domain